MTIRKPMGTPISTDYHYYHCYYSLLNHGAVHCIKPWVYYINDPISQTMSMGTWG
jgi:hypothetical protein